MDILRDARVTRRTSRLNQKAFLLLAAAFTGCAAAPEPPYSADGYLTLTDQSNPVFALVFSPDGKTFVTGGSPWPKEAKSRSLTEREQITVWHTETAKRAFQFESDDMGRGNRYCTLCLVFSPDGTWLASGETSAQFGGPVRTFWVVEARGAWLSGGGGAFGNVAGDGNTSVHPEKYEKEYRLNHLWQIALSPNGKYLANTSGARGVEIEDVSCVKFEGGKSVGTGFPELLAKGANGFASCVAYAPDSKTLASAGGPDKAIHWWQPNPGKEATILATFKHDAPVIRVGFTSDGKTLAAGDDGGTLKLWDLDKKEARHTIKAHAGDVGALAVSPTRQVVATGGPDKVIKLWDAVTGKELASLPDQKGRIQALAFSPDGKILAASACDPFEKGEVRLWDVAKVLSK